MSNKEFIRNFAIRARRRLVGKENAVNVKIKVISNDDPEFKSKFENLQSQKEVVSNPLKYLMDEKLMKKMDEESKERYLLSVLDKYCALRNQVENKSSDSRFCM